jgi:receptor protein-tyrosine kinase
VELKDVIQAVRHGWWLVAVGVLLGLGGAGLLTWQTTPTYTSSTQLFVSTTSSDDASVYQGNIFSQQRVASYVEILTSQRLAGRVIEQLGLQESSATLAQSITAATVPDTVLLDVSVVRTSPTEARDIAAAVGQQFSLMVTELETPDGATASPVTVTVIEDPEVVSAATSPRPMRNVALGLLVGIVLGGAAAMVRERMDNTVKTPDDIEKLTGVAVVGALTEDPGISENGVISDDNGYSETAEAYRQIRTNLQFVDVDEPARTIVVTSSLPGEGKTTVAVNLAVVLAQSGARVALIEADLRRPRVTRYLGIISGAGLSNVLAGSARYEEVVQSIGEGHLSVLAAGPMPPYPSEMLGSKHMRSLLEEVRQTNDYVIIDAPPLLPVTDGAVLSKVADGALLVARHGMTTRAQLDQAVGALEHIDAKLLGVVLNRIPPKAAEGYGYGYNYAYSAVAAVEGDDSAVKKGRAPVVDHTTIFPAIRDDAPRARVRGR